MQGKLLRIGIDKGAFAPYHIGGESLIAVFSDLFIRQIACSFGGF